MNKKDHLIGRLTSSSPEKDFLGIFIFNSATGWKWSNISMTISVWQIFVGAWWTYLFFTICVFCFSSPGFYKCKQGQQFLSNSSEMLAIFFLFSIPLTLQVNRLHSLYVSDVFLNKGYAMWRRRIDQRTVQSQIRYESVFNV